MKGDECDYTHAKKAPAARTSQRPGAPCFKHPTSSHSNAQCRAQNKETKPKGKPRTSVNKVNGLNFNAIDKTTGEPGLCNGCHSPCHQYDACPKKGASEAAALQKLTNERFDSIAALLQSQVGKTSVAAVEPARSADSLLARALGKLSLNDTPSVQGITSRTTATDDDIEFEIASSAPRRKQRHRDSVHMISTEAAGESESDSGAGEPAYGLRDTNGSEPEDEPDEPGQPTSKTAPCPTSPEKSTSNATYAPEDVIAMLDL